VLVSHFLQVKRFVRVGIDLEGEDGAEDASGDAKVALTGVGPNQVECSTPWR
jgi:hypothetical protein